MTKQLRPADEAPHLLSAYRQLDNDGRRGLVRRILAVAVERIGMQGDDFDVLVPACIEIAHTSKSATEKAAAELARLCVRWLESAEPAAEAFAHVAIEYGRLDPVFKLAGGRPVGAVGEKAAYMAALVLANPGASAKALYKRALNDVDSDQSPFDKDAVGDLFDHKSGKAVSGNAWAKLVTATRNSKKR